MAYKTISYHFNDGIGKITMNRPKELNALSTEMFEELILLLNSLSKDQTLRVLVITGAGKAFCAGGDLQEMKAGFADNYGFYEHMLRANRFTAMLVDFPKPVIAAVNGPATGAGMNVALAADIAIASERAKFSEIFGNVGLAPDVGGTYLLPRVVGKAKAKELIFSYRMVDAKEALALGIVNEVVPPEELEKAVTALAEKIAKGPTFAFGLAKKIVNRSYEMDMNAALDMEAMAQALAGNSEDHKEGVRAFFEKRSPQFKGR